ncbi:Mll7596 protein [alpha proteobacterium U9-1i]|nr:Mll7596 protein [alpha proteobacterium U9-1i]
MLRNEGGTAAVEFAIIAPVLIAMLMGIISFGSYFWTAHTVQQMANDAARAAIGGLSDPERTELARASLSAGMADQGMMDPTRMSVEISRTGPSLTVSVAYDASDSIFAALSSLIPITETRVERSASIRLGGL